MVEIRRSKPEYYFKKYMEENISSSIDVKSVSKYFARSPSYVVHKFKELYGCTFHQFLTQMRIEHSKKLLKIHPISEVYQLCGFKNRFHFSKTFKNLEGISPHLYQLNLNC
jgi:two-component system response regulator YesN